VQNRTSAAFLCPWSALRALQFSYHLPAFVGYALIVSNIHEVTDDKSQNERGMMGVPILCGYSDMGTPKSDQIVRGESIMLYNVFGTLLTCTKITGGIGPWPKFNHEWGNVNTDVLAMSGTRSFIEARGRTRTFHCLFEVPSRIAEDFLQVAREAFHVPAGPGQQDALPIGPWAEAKASPFEFSAKDINNNVVLNFNAARTAIEACGHTMLQAFNA
jgi:hypothetical protein